jgi:signal transduction histidine kinase
MRRPLKYQLLLPWLTVTLLVVVALSVSGALLASQRVRSDLRQSLRNIAQTLVQTNFPIEDSVLRQASGLSGATFAAIDDSGRIRAASATNVAIPKASPPVTSAGALELSHTALLEGQSFFHAVVELDRRPVGGRRESLHIFYPERQLSEARWQAFWPPLLAGLIATVLLLAITTVMAGRVTRPIEQLGRHAEDIAHGKFEPIAVPERNDEIRDLVVSINRMTAMLAKYEEEVRRSERLRTLGQLGGGIAHQIRNAVTGCRMALDLHQRECGVGFQPALEDARAGKMPAPLKADDTLDVATRQLELIERYLQRFLTLGRAPQTRTEHVELVALLRNVEPLIKPAAQHAGVSVMLELPAGTIDLKSDPHAIEQIMVNLLLNAIEAVSNGERREVVVRLTTDNRVALVEVMDSGPGVSPAVRDKLFEPFATTKPDGVGLGLATARDLARSLGGELELRDEAGPTGFCLSLPRIAGK